MAEYSYVAKVIGKNDSYQITGDAFAEDELHVIGLMIRDLSSKTGLDPKSFKVAAFSAIKHEGGS